MPNLDEMHLLNVTVSPDHQRQGFGRWLMQVLMARAVAAGSQSVWLEVRQSNRAAIALYNALGFVTLRQRKDYYPAANGQRENAWVMRWNAQTSLQTAQGAAP
jgi:ribosomal-protein-alanine N-acetyltransferase